MLAEVCLLNPEKVCVNILELVLTSGHVAGDTCHIDVVSALFKGTPNIRCSF